MKTAFAAIAMAGVAAAFDGPTIQRGCLSENAQDVGSRADDDSHYDFYLRSNFSNADVPSSYRIRQTVVCVDYNDPTWYGRLTGFTFVLADPTDPDPATSGNWVKLPWIGY